jgi:hypothetical protein
MATIARSVDLSVVGANGGGWCTDLGAATPATPATFDEQPAAAFHPLGAISEEGLTYGFDEDNQEFIAWGQLTPYRAQITRSLRTFQVTLWETNRSICKSAMFRLPLADVAYNAGTGLFSFEESATPTPDRRAWIFDVMDGPTMERFYVPVGEITDRDDVEFTSEEIAGYNVTVTAYADEDNVTVYHLGKVVLSGS